MGFKSFPYLFLSIIILVFVPACSSGNDLTEEVFEIVEKNTTGEKDSIQNNPEQNYTDTAIISNKDDQVSSDTHYFKMEPYFPLTDNGGQQGATIYGNYLFHATTYKKLIIYNMKEKEHIATISLETMGHADTMCFGVQKVEESDEFPVLYISGSQSNTLGKGGEIFVYRIIHSKDENGNEIWQGTLIQHIVTPDVAIIGSFPDVVIDPENKNMWIMGWLTSYGYDSETGEGCTNCFSKFNIPDIKEGKPNNKGVYQLTLTDEKRLSYFLVNDIHAITQGLCYYNGKIICPYGKPAVPYKGIDVVDVTKEYLTHNVNLYGAKIYEIESAVIYDNKLYLVGQRDNVYSCSGLDL